MGATVSIDGRRATEGEAAFRVNARTLLHLGRDLIASDAIALFELVKNGLDAGSPLVHIHVLVRAPHEIVEQARIELHCDGLAVSSEAFRAIQARLSDSIDLSAPNAEELLDSIRSAGDSSALKAQIDAINTITVSDIGHGMSLDVLRSVYLVVGTPMRRNQLSHMQRSGSGDPILGDKGIGRLAVMRLGRSMSIQTTIAGEKRRNCLDIRWDLFEDTSKELGEIPVYLRHCGTKEDRASHGTVIEIRGLESEWTKRKLMDLAKGELSRLVDPFGRHRVPIRLRFNGDKVRVADFSSLLFESAHAHVSGEFVTEPPSTTHGVGAYPRISARVDYKLRTREQSLALDGDHLASSAGCRPDVLQSLGPFSFEFYWYNRRVLAAIEGIGNKAAVRKLVNQWSGGLMLYRDGFRVLPYGAADDDWLGMDEKSHAASGYMVNRHQIIGRVLISRAENPKLEDKTNREGLRDGPETRAFVGLLEFLLNTWVRPFISSVEEEIRANNAVGMPAIQHRVNEQLSGLLAARGRIEKLLPDGEARELLLRTFEQTTQGLQNTLIALQNESQVYEARTSKLLNLAGLGLMVEIIAHELNRATHYALRSISELRSSTEDGHDALDSLSVQLKTLQKRLSVLDPMSTAGRQRKSEFDLLAVLRRTLASHEGQFARHGVVGCVIVRPEGRSRVQLKAVEGMIVQILENLIDNSMYWLKQKRSRVVDLQGRIQIALDADSKEVRFSDNGPGIPVELCDKVFEPFFTTKPPGQEKGLGLYISKEIANYHGFRFTLDPRPDESGRLRTFVLSLAGSEEAD